MTIGAFETYLAQQPTETAHRAKVSMTAVAGRLQSGWLITPFAGAAPTTAVVPARNVAGAVGQQNAVNSSTSLRLRRLRFSRGFSGYAMLCDRLSHQGGLSGIVATAQTTNLPTAALTRYTDGVGVFMGLEIYSVVGTTATSASVSYTNQAGTAGRASTLVAFGGTAFREAGRMIVLPTQSDDFGVRSVQSATLLVTTGAAGNFGVTLFKPLYAVPVVGGAVQDHDSLIGLNCQTSRILDDACLFWMHVCVGTNSGTFNSTMDLAQD